ncbi:MAG: FhaA domain-containing protein [Actinomycetota bacterium]
MTPCPKPFGTWCAPPQFRRNPLGLAEEFERRLERLVEGFFSRAFRSPIQPAEIGRRLLREMEGGKTVSVGAVYVPNSYRIRLAPPDVARFEGLVPSLTREFSELLRRNAEERRWRLPGGLLVCFEEDAAVAAGRFEVQAAHEAGIEVEASLLEESHVLWLVGSDPPQSWELNAERVTLSIGRLPESDVSLTDPNASRRHAQVLRRDDGWWIMDLGSTNGTLVNGALMKERRLAPGDVIQIGTTRIEYRKGDET